MPNVNDDNQDELLAGIRTRECQSDRSDTAASQISDRQCLERRWNEAGDDAKCSLRDFQASRRQTKVRHERVVSLARDFVSLHFSGWILRGRHRRRRRCRHRQFIVDRFLLKLKQPKTSLDFSLHSNLP